ncbi:exodeoxyribonuclease VII large subunit [Coxiella endosymbiont of Amblyomma nuttalli]|uniref:exodeoxyribonuclease VII large subunit n=1 Tax=Coxiella endosymbiont of Amblyomma nuttalli TaxID=2749996 RepID=UPI001BA7F6CC|nr:exodeoxyribonuclease VII large subunit [Coxiella endosymbiont of Amblyomma nuttalli]QTS83844.1 Exodeoxyribonuclease 7 large subunit [Coxiella endosymbiont of Amblyomma nuttalli]
MKTIISPFNIDTVYTVSQLTDKARIFLEGCFRHVWITGEISNLSRPSSKHLYFSLKDERTQVRCAFFHNYNRQLNFLPKNGCHVLLQAQVSLYETRGDFQLIVVQMQATGSGAVQVAFEKLKQQLEKEGLFVCKNKKSIPAFPTAIGLITSPSGAAISDILKVLKRRFPSISVIVYPTIVQGEKASLQIVHAIQTANRRKECDVLLLARGGGSIEDLWPFNEESVARAIFDCKIPIVTGIGHEIDFTIADFVADHHAATPSAAAECVSPNCKEYLQHIHSLQQRLSHLIYTQLRQHHIQLHYLMTRLQRPEKRLETQQHQLTALKHRLIMAMDYDLSCQRQHLAFKVQILQTMNPLTTLKRGYAIITYQKEIIHKATSLKVGDCIVVRLEKGSIACRVEEVHAKINLSTRQKKI